MNKVDDRIGDCFCDSEVRVLISLCTSMLTVSAGHRWWRGSQMSGKGRLQGARTAWESGKLHETSADVFPTTSRIILFQMNFL